MSPGALLDGRRCVFQLDAQSPGKKLCVSGEKEKPDEKQSNPLFFSFSLG